MGNENRRATNGVRSVQAVIILESNLYFFRSSGPKAPGY